MKHIEQDLSLMAWVHSTGLDLEGWAKAKIKLFSACCMSNLSQ